MNRVRETLDALRSTLRNRAIARLQVAVAGASLGQWMVSVTVGVVVFQAGGPGAVGLAIVCRMIPSALAALLLGPLVDRLPRRAVMACAAGAVGTLMMVNAAVIAAGLPYGCIILVSTLSGVAGSPFEPARAAILPSLARTPDELTAANVVSSTTDSVALAAGPAIGAVLLAATSPQATLVVAAGFMALAVLAVLGIRPVEDAAGRGDDAEQGEAHEPGMLHELGEGLRVALTDPRVRLITGLMAAQLIVDGAVGVLSVAAALDLLDLGESGVGTLNTMIGVGAFAGAAGALALIGRRRLAPSFALGMCLWGLPLIAIGLVPVTGVALVALVALGFGNTILDVSGYTMLQRGAPEDVLGRVFGVFEAMALAAVALGAAVAPVIIDLAGLQAALVIVGAFLPLLALACFAGLRKAELLARPVPEEVARLVLGTPMFAPLPAFTIETLCEHLEPVEVPAGVAVVTQGERGDRFYLIAEGELDVDVDGERVRAHGPGESFGEVALVRDIPRTATVTARTAARLYALGRDDFLAAVTGHAESERAAAAVASGRLARARPVAMAG